MMNIFDQQKKLSVYCIGIGGIGISGLAKLLLHEGHAVAGVNDSESPETLDELREQGVSIDMVEHGKEESFDIPAADVYVYSAAWEARAPHIMKAARATEKPVLSYFEGLGYISAQYNTIAIAGTHGKTTTTAMVAQALVAAGFDPTVIVGSLVDWGNGVRSNFRASTSTALSATTSNKLLVVEACEYKRHFLHLHPQVLAITNIELDHPDYYKNFDDVQSAFDALAAKAHTVVTQNDAQALEAKVPRLIVPGVFNIQNAALALAVCSAVGANIEKAQHALTQFTGTWRRFEYKGITENGAVVYDDYAHHPTAITATIAAARQLHPGARIVAVFEAHMFSRTQTLLPQFARALATADYVVVAPIYAAREMPIESIDQYTLAEKVGEQGTTAIAADTLEDAARKGAKEAKKDDVLLCMSAGDMYQQIPAILKNHDAIPER